MPDLATPWNAAYQAPPSMGFSRQEYWRGMPLPSPIALTRQIFVGKVMSLLFNMLSRLVITFLPRNKGLLISWLQSPSARLQDIKSWVHISQLQKAFPDIWSWANAEDLKIKLTSKRDSQYQGKLLPPEGSDWECFFTFLLPSLSDHALELLEK